MSLWRRDRVVAGRLELRSDDIADAYLIDIRSGVLSQDLAGLPLRAVERRGFQLHATACRTLRVGSELS